MDRYRIKPGEKISLKDYDPADAGDWGDKKQQAKQRVTELCAKLDNLQGLLYAQHEHKILVILQAMDTGGKDGTIRGVFSGVNPQGVHIASFKVPTQEELDHDFLWRIHAQAPGKGELVVFNRSHYEDVLVVRVHKIVPESVWKQRYDLINDFEHMLVDTGSTVVKFFLYIDEAEQKQRLLDRLDDPTKLWKFNPGDLDERKLWPEYMKAYEAALNKTSTKWAPWYIVPSNRKWYRDLVIATVLVKTLESLKMTYPQPEWNVEEMKKKLSLE